MARGGGLPKTLNIGFFRNLTVRVKKNKQNSKILLVSLKKTQEFYAETREYFFILCRLVKYNLRVDKRCQNCLNLCLKSLVIQWRSQPDIWSCKCKFFCVYRPYKESISKEMNNDNLNLHLHDQMSVWLRYCSRHILFEFLNFEFLLRKRI